jgi:uncharacterized protein YfaS (alpha-2-macroglobulin family)
MLTRKFAAFLPVFVLLCFLLPACKGKKSEAQTMEESQAMPAALLAHTAGVIGRLDPLYVTFDSLPEGIDVEKLISIAPVVKGTLSLQGNSLTFTPEDGWASGTQYTGLLKLSSIFDEGDYSFSFSTPARRAEVISEGIYVPADQVDALEIRGRVITNDGASVEEINQLISARQDGKSLNVSVSAADGGQAFTYTVQGPDRSANPSPVTIYYDGTSLGFADTKGELNVEVPPAGTFRVESVDVDDLGDGAVIVRFSDALDARQNVNGLVRFEPSIAYTASIDGNLLKIYPKGRDHGEATMMVSTGIKNANSKPLSRQTAWSLNLGRTEPMLRMVGRGAIMPHQGKRLFPFEAIGLDAVQLELFEIYADNVQQYLKDNSISDESGDWTLRRVGKIVAQERIPLSQLSGSVNPTRWSRYAIDLSKYIGDQTGSIYQVRLGFAMEDASVGCDLVAEDFGLNTFSFREGQEEFNIGFSEPNSRLGDYYGVYGYYDEFDWEDRDDPCMPAYYNRDRFVTQNILSSNLGLITKRNPDRSTVVFATDLITAAPRTGVTVTAYSYQQKELFRGTTDGDGKVRMETEERPAVIIASAGGDAAYLDLFREGGLALARFDVGGTNAAGGIKGAFYRERGVWRPGDSVYLHFVLEDRDNRLPDEYPVEFTLTDAQGRVMERRTVRPAFDMGLYPLDFVTDEGDVTGEWMATVTAGGQSYQCPLMIETIKPNRLDIDLRMPAGGISGGSRTATLSSKWLYGAPAANLEATVDMSISARSPDFPKWTNYLFHDPARKIERDAPRQIFSGNLDASGVASFELPSLGSRLPGPLHASMSTKVFEPGGNFSIDNQRLPLDPYGVYAGLSIPLDDWGTKRVALNGGSSVQLAAVDTRGEGVAGRKLSVGIYRVNWRYWWQDNYDNVARFNGTQHREAIGTYSAITNADGSAVLKVGVEEWGRYLIRICDEGGHCSGDYFYAGYNQEEEDRESASLLRLSASQEQVSVGDEVVVKVPTSAGGNLLVSLETGAGTLKQFWVPAEAGQTEITFRADAEMVPTVYANVSLLQPYEQTTNDRPVRLYGVIPIEVTDPATVLDPSLTLADEWRPGEKVAVSVKESGGKPMAYTLAVVDEGLLGLTRFQTPDLHDRFFGKEALSVRTYDLYRYVIGSLNGAFGKVLAIGGDGAESGEEEPTANRFEPVVRHLGPFYLDGGKTGRHEIQLPNYVGAVRVMVVATGKRAYGSIGRRVPVRQPLMVLPTLPRVLGPGESVDMPVNVFAMTDGIRNVDVAVAESEGLVRVNGGGQALTFQRAGDQLAYFPLQVGERAGVAKFSVTGKANGEEASQEIEIAVRHPNEVETRTQTVSIAAGTEQTIPYQQFGLPGTRETILELSALPAMNLDQHLKYLLRYPYGCVEQTVSPAFAQLFLDQMTELTPEQDQRRRANVVAGLNALRKFQTSSGGMGYWPGNRDAHPWASNYVLHFLTEAERAGFGIPFDLKNSLVQFQTRAASNWRADGEVFYVSRNQLMLDQAYRLYGLAKAGKADIGAMNRLRGQAAELPAPARFQLAASYAILGRQQVAAELIDGVATVGKSYRELGYTFGSQLRDMAMILESQLALEDKTAADRQAFRLAEQIGKRGWLSTQEAAFAFVALGKENASAGQQISADFTSPTGAQSAVGSNSGIYQIELPTADAGGTITLKNTGTGTLYATVIMSGKPGPGNERATNENLVMTVTYTDLDGRELDVSQLPSGTDFIANYTVRNPGTLGMSYRQLALRSLLPSGWEVSNERMAGTDGAEEAQFAYRDYRDDRVYTFFHLNRGETKNFALRMTATYPGRYYLPAQTSEAMYADDVRAAVTGQWVEVTR